MFHYILVGALSCILMLCRFAHAFEDQPILPPLHTGERYADKTGSVRATHPRDALTSITRMTESRKARQFYEKAKRAWVAGLDVEAQNKLDKALKVDPTFPEALTLYGIIHTEHQRWKSAEASLKAAIQSDPSDAPAYVVLAGVYNSEERFDDAQEATTQALSAGADSWHVTYEIARAFIGKGQYESALAAIDALRASTDHGWLSLVRALALVGLQRYREAAMEVRLFLFSEPSDERSNYARDLLEQIEGLIVEKEPQHIAGHLPPTQ
jgi:tetratricopeptide (TPR) repeat protein